MGTEPKKDVEEGEEPQDESQPAGACRKRWHYEWRSQTEFLGYPLVHVNVGRDDDGNLRSARGLVAIGQFAVGVIVLAQFGIGLVAVCQFAIALAALAQFGLALVTVAQFGVGIAVLAQYGVGVWASGTHTSAADD